MNNEEFIRRYSNEKEALTQFLADKEINIDCVCEQMGSQAFNALVTELAGLGKILDCAVDSAKANDHMAVVQHGVKAKMQKDAVYSILLQAGMRPFEQNGYTGPLRNYVMSRYNQGIKESANALAENNRRR